MTKAIQITTTAGSRAEADQIAAHLVERRLAACVQVSGPITSTYRWQGKVEMGDEWLCVAKTSEALFAAVESAIRALHSYQTPEIIATPIVAASADYLAWLLAQLAADETAPRPAQA